MNAVVAISDLQEERQTGHHHREHREHERLGHYSKSPDGDAEIRLVEMADKSKGRVVHIWAVGKPDVCIGAQRSLGVAD
ncbi:hypothetical protein PMAYCL1PPCAC_26530, partial [Pristionchus mayeri]